MASHTSGVTLRLRTSASRLCLEMLFQREVAPGRETAAHLATVVSGDRVQRFDEGDLLLEQPDRSARVRAGSATTVLFDVTPGDVTIWLPNSAGVTILAGWTDAPVEALRSEQPRWVHYGSSISHGSDLDDPRRLWPVQAARTLDYQLTNLGFAGNAMLDPFVARAIGELPADLITLKLGINIVNGDAMRSRTFVPAVHGFLDLIRDRQPTTPIVVISALGCAIHETIPGPVREVWPGKAGGTPRETRPFDGTLTLERTRQHLADVVEHRDDPNLRLINGLDLLRLDEGDLLPDNLHPNGEGHDLIARRFSAALTAE
jgi:hypothetical protein